MLFQYCYHLWALGKMFYMSLPFFLIFLKYIIKQIQMYFFFLIYGIITVSYSIDDFLEFSLLLSMVLLFHRGAGLYCSEIFVYSEEKCDGS